MKAGLKFPGSVVGLSTNSAGALQLRVATKELGSSSKLALIELQEVPCMMTFEPTEDSGGVIDAEVVEPGKKSQLTRLRNTLYVLWNQQGSPGSRFDGPGSWYEDETEQIITAIKMRLRPN